MIMYTTKTAKSKGLRGMRSIRASVTDMRGRELYRIARALAVDRALDQQRIGVLKCRREQSVGCVLVGGHAHPAADGSGADARGRGVRRRRVRAAMDDGVA